MKAVLVFLLCVGVVFAQTEQDYEDQCECALGPAGDGVPYPCGHVCTADGYQCHLAPGNCPDGKQCVLVGANYACQCIDVCTTCGQVACGETCLVGCGAEQTCVNEGAGYFCKANTPTCAPSCANKLCGETDGCGGRCATGACTNPADICGGGGLDFVCGRPKKNPKSNGLAWGLIGGGLGAGACAGGIIYVKRRQRKNLMPADLKAGQVEATACVEVETDQGTTE